MTKPLNSSIEDEEVEGQVSDDHHDCLRGVPTPRSPPSAYRHLHNPPFLPSSAEMQLNHLQSN